MSKQLQLPTVPSVSDPALQTYLDQLHAVVAQLHLSAQQPNLPTNLTLTPGPGTVTVQFTRSNAITYTLYISPTPDRAGAVQVDLRSSNQYTDNVGVGGETRNYWVEGLNQSGISSGVTPPKSAITLALGTPATILPTVPQSYAQVFDTTLGRNRPVISTIDTEVAGQPAPAEG